MAPVRALPILMDGLSCTLCLGRWDPDLNIPKRADREPIDIASCLLQQITSDPFGIQIGLHDLSFLSASCKFNGDKLVRHRSLRS